MYKGIDYEIAVLFALFNISVVAIICLVDQCKQKFTSWFLKREHRKSVGNTHTMPTTPQ